MGRAILSWWAGATSPTEMLRCRHNQLHFLLNSVAGLLLVARMLDLYTLPQAGPWWLPKLLHLVGMVMFVGNIASVGVWSGWLMRSPHRELVLAASTSIVRSDRRLTWPGQVLVVLSGVWMMGDVSFAELGAHIRWSVWLFLLSLVLTVPMLIAQDKLLIVIDCKNGHEKRLAALRPCVLWGGLAALPMVPILWLMVSKGSW